MNPETPLVIDAHTHVFNATDLPIRNFVTRVVARDSGFESLANAVGGVLQFLGWNGAPDARDEQRRLRSLRGCDGDATNSGLRSLRQDAYEQARSELQAAAREDLRSRGGSARTLMSLDPASLSDAEAALRGIQELPETFEEYAGEGSGSESLVVTRTTVRSAIAFLVEMFQYRTTSVFNYLRIYNEDDVTPVDLITPALVDYDWWISRGKPTRSLLPEQVRLMGDIAETTAGRSHMLVPFCPFRQVMADLGDDRAGFSPLALVREAVEEQGALGVKLYPPMGFAPYGNASLDLWSDKPLARPAHEPDFGRRLDDALGSLYDYCQREGVPVMAHSSPSNAAHEDYLELVGPHYFQQLSSAFPSLRVNLGHFGGHGSGGGFDLDAWLDYLSHGVGTRFADASYFANLEDAPVALRALMERLFTHEDGRLVSSIVYGSDWKMLLAESSSRRYLTDFRRLVEDIEQQSGGRLRDRFLGVNASAYYGLGQPKTRSRLSEFYRGRSMAQPYWFAKL